MRTLVPSDCGFCLCVAVIRQCDPCFEDYSMHVAHNFSLQDDKLDRAERAARAVEEIGASSKKNHQLFERTVAHASDQNLHSCGWSFVRESGGCKGSVDSFETFLVYALDS